ncbi:luciferin 4-monooxygenase-like [Rhipicephalus microplus]|uniref:luciferin 4-monooxygenase-like n=1 Tax=Rhipicephalus microplus TaxID=6941 RepID=UPI003F6BF1A9
MTCTISGCRREHRKKLGPGQRGEIRIESPCCALDYLNNSQATAELYDEEGFLKTGSK